MHRRLFSVLLMVALLVPQGMCVCDLVQPACAACVEASEPEQPVEGACSCRCKRHQTKTIKPVASLPSHSCTHSAPEHEDHHLPTCPVKVGNLPWKADSLHRPFATQALVADVVAVIDGTIPNGHPVSPVFSHPSFSEQSLYLTLLTLRL